MNCAQTQGDYLNKLPMEGEWQPAYVCIYLRKGSMYNDYVRITCFCILRVARASTFIMHVTEMVQNSVSVMNHVRCEVGW